MGCWSRLNGHTPLAWDSAGRLWVTEYGANRLDELNLVQRGGNYGWPMAEGRAVAAGLIDPVVQWPVDEASPSGLAYFGGSLWFTTSNRDGRGSPRDGDDQILQYRP